MSQLEPLAAKRHLFAWHASMGVTYISSLASLLRTRHGIETILFTSNVEALRFAQQDYGFDPTAFAEIIDISRHLAPTPEKDLPEPARLAAAAAAAEAGLHHTITDIIRTDRHIGLGFVTETVFMRSRFRLAFTFPQSIDLVIRLLGFYDDQLRRYRPIAALAFPACVRMASLVALCERDRIPFRQLVCSRVGNAACWTDDWFNTPHGLEAAYGAALAEVRARDPAWLSGKVRAAGPRPFNAQIWFDQAGPDLKLGYLLKRLRNVFKFAAIRWIKRPPPSAYGDYLVRDRLWLIVNRWLWRRWSVRQAPVMPSHDAGMPYVFFPLPIEPETTLETEAQEWNQPLALIDLLAKCVPTGWAVVVKEHPMATAPRRAGFWDRVGSYPNVVVAAPGEPGEDILANARVVAVINGTLGIQAAIVGKPVVTPHRHFLANMLPHVFCAQTPRDMRTALTNIRAENIAPLEERLVAGAAYELALERTQFAVKSQALLSDVVAKEAQDAEDIETLAETLLATLANAQSESRATAMAV